MDPRLNKRLGHMENKLDEIMKITDRLENTKQEFQVILDNFIKISEKYTS